MKANGRMILNMDRERLLGLMGMSILAIIKKGCVMAKESWLGQMAIAMKESLRMVKKMDRDNM